MSNTKDKAPSIFIEWSDQKNSGWIMDGTKGKGTETQLRAPNMATVPNIGYRADYKEENGRKTKYNKAIRYIKNCPYIDIDEQKKYGFEPHVKTPQIDKIVVEKGYATVVREGDTGLYDYLVNVFYNESNMDRPNSATALFRVVDLEKQAETVNENDFLVSDAMQVIKSIAPKVGNIFQYNEAKIDSLCQLFAVYAESYPNKVKSLQNFAKARPQQFLDKVTNLEETTVTEVTHALQLNIIQFKDNSVEYKNKDKVITNLGTGKMKHGEQIKKFADLLRTPEYHAAYMELKAEIETAKEEQLKG